jgi:transposase-like protein
MVARDIPSDRAASALLPPACASASTIASHSIASSGLSRWRRLARTSGGRSCTSIVPERSVAVTLCSTWSSCSTLSGHRLRISTLSASGEHDRSDRG